MEEQTLSLTPIYNGRLLRLEVQDVELSGGRSSRREIVRHPGAVAIVAQIPNGRFLLVRQYRKAVNQTLLEIPAGCLEPDEKPEDCVRREIREETGYTVAELTPLGSVFSSPGFCDEVLWLFYARLQREAGTPQPDDDETIETILLERAEFEHAVRAGSIRDAKTLSAWLLFTTRESG